MSDEFSLIDRFFKWPVSQTKLAIGDDAALFSCAPDSKLVISTDMLVEGTHFLASQGAQNIGWKSLAVNLSDLAAMGATPKWTLLSLGVVQGCLNWIESFSRGFRECADCHYVDLIGGDTVRSQHGAVINVVVIGELPNNQGLLRSSAKPGDDIWVSGHLGLAAAGLAQLLGHVSLEKSIRLCCQAALEKPVPRIALGQALLDLAHAAIDISDGFLQDLTHILKASNVKARVFVEKLPMREDFSTASLLTDQDRQRYALSGGEDYELLFTASKENRQLILSMSEKLLIKLSRVGFCLEKDDESSNQWVDLTYYGQDYPYPTCLGFKHF